jgi:MFS family permease
LEGVAEATAGLSKSYFGKLSDLSSKRLPFVQFGYLLSAISKPMMAVFMYPLWIFFSRTMDRLGKGIRTAARDAMLSDEATSETKGQVFGLHRAMDTLGAVIGPAFALLYLYLYPENYKPLFFIAFIPGMVAISFTLFIQEKKKDSKKIKLKAASIFSFVHYWKQSASAYKKLVGGLLAFTLINSSDVFLLLKVKEAGLNDSSVIGVYVFYNLIYALASYPLGKLSDRIGFKKMLLFGLLVFAVVYTGMALSHELYQFFILFFLYGIYAAATEGVTKAWISNISDTKDTATAIGTYTGFQSVCTMMASAIAGWVWITFGAPATFLFTAGSTILISVYLFGFVQERKHLK